MSDLSSFTSKFRAQRIASSDSSSRKVTKRPRASLVCNQCRKNKLRCDRNQPCASCISRNEAEICAYSTPAGSRVDLGRFGIAEDRLMHLESMVKQLMETQTAAPPSRSTGHGQDSGLQTAVPATVTDLRQRPSREPAEASSFVGSTHWSVILDDIHEIRSVLGGADDEIEEEAPTPPRSSSRHEDLVFGASDIYSTQDIIRQFLPPKVEVDRFLATYLRGESFVVPCIHTGQFQGQYRKFWTHTANVNAIWLSQLFSICYMASYVRESTGSSKSGQDDSGDEKSKYHTASAQCLVLGHYQRPQRFVPEALAMYAQCKNLQSLEPSREGGAVMAMAVRIAYEMGYHRDGASVGTFTPFEVEMRRRLWAACTQMHLMLSFQLGVPSSIRFECSDTKAPSNLFDSDLEEDMDTAPTSRPESEATPLLWFVVKDRQMPTFSKVCQHALSVHADNGDVLQLDTDIRRMHDTVPEMLRPRSLADSIGDPPFLIITRIFTEIVHLKSLCVLHRRHMADGNDFSTRTCLQAASRIVSHFVDMHHELSPGGQLYFERWMMTTFTVNDFLLAVLVLCHFLHIQWKLSARQAPSDIATATEVGALLRQAYTVCVELSDASNDVRRVSNAVRMTLNSFGSSRTPKDASTTQSQPRSPSTSDATESASEGTPVGGAALAPSSAYTNAEAVNETLLTPSDPFNLSYHDLLNVDWSELDPATFGDVYQ